MTLRAFLFTLLVITLCHSTYAKKRDRVPAVKSDLPYIRCAVCEATAKSLSRQVSQMRKDATAVKKVKEIDILDVVEKICDPEKEEGEWITKIDLLEDEDKLTLVEHDMPQKCNSECSTIARSCSETIGDYDTDLAEELFTGEVQRAKLTQKLCVEMSGACSKKAPKLKKDRKEGPAFTPLTEEEVNMMKLTREFGGMDGMEGMNLNMYNKDDLMNELGEDYENEDDDDDEDPVPPLEKIRQEMTSPPTGNAEESTPDFDPMVYVEAAKDGLNMVAEKVQEFAKSAYTSAVDIIGKLEARRAARKAAAKADL